MDDEGCEREAQRARVLGRRDFVRSIVRASALTISTFAMVVPTASVASAQQATYTVTVGPNGSLTYDPIHLEHHGWGLGELDINGPTHGNAWQELHKDQDVVFDSVSDFTFTFWNARLIWYLLRDTRPLSRAGGGHQRK